MAKPREPVKPDPPAESDEESSDEGSESESEPEPSQKKAPSAPAPAPKKPEPTTSKTQPTAASSSSSDDEESGSDTDSETPVKKPDPNIKPIASKPMDDPAQKTTATTTAKKPRSKPNSSGPTSPTRSSTGAGAKRPAAAAAAVAADEGKDSKRSKKKPETEAEGSVKKGNSNDDSRKLFQRLWSEDDEIVILKGMLDYSAKKKADPLDDLDAFHEFIKKNLHIDVTTVQLKDKIRRLKKKYKNNADKERKGNKERTFSKPHEQKAYDFSKKVWGSEKNGGGGGEEEIVESQVNGTAVRKNRGKSAVGMTSRIDEVEEKVKEVKDLVSEKNVEVLKNVSFVPDSLRIEEWVLKYGTDLIKDPKKRAEMEEKWRKHKVKEIELLSVRSELMTELTTLILDGLK